MKPTNPSDLYNYKALVGKNKKDDELIKKLLEAAWKKDYKTRL